MPPNKISPSTPASGEASSSMSLNVALRSWTNSLMILLQDPKLLRAGRKPGTTTPNPYAKK